MKKLQLLKGIIALLLCGMGWTNANAVETAGYYYQLYATQYERAQGTYEIGKTYSIYTEVNGTKWYLTIGGDLSDVPDFAGQFTIKEGVAGEFPKAVFLRYGDGTRSFIALDFVANRLYQDGDFLPGRYGSKANNDAFNSQVLLMDENGNYAIRGSNGSKTGTSTWNDYCTNTYWAIEMVNDVPVLENDKPVIGNTQGVPQFIWHFADPVPVPLLTDFDLDESRPLITDVSQFSSPWCDPVDGIFENLIDDDPSTFWQSKWQGVSATMHQQYIQVELNESIDELIAMKFTHRPDLNRDCPDIWSIWGSNDPDTRDDDWTLLAYLTTPYTTQGETLNTIGFDTKGFTFLRIYVENTTGTAGNRGFWGVAELNFYPCVLADELTAAIRELTDVYYEYSKYEEEFTFNQGSTPGQYQPEAVEAFVTALDNATKVDMGQSVTVEEVRAMIDAIKDTYQAVLDSKIPFTLADGYYRLRCGLVFVNNVPTGDVDEDGQPITEEQEVYKYMYSVLEDNTIYARWNTPANLDSDCPSLWKVTNKDGYFDIVNCATDARFDLCARSASLTMSAESTNLIAADLICNYDDTPYLNLRVSSQAAKDYLYFHAAGHSGGTGVSGNIVGWCNGGGTLSASEWTFEAVDDAAAAAIIEAYEPYKNHAVMVENFKVMRDDAGKKLGIAKDLTVNVDEERPFITDANQFTSPWSDPNEGADFGALIDGNPNTFWQSQWRNVPATMHYQYLQVELSEPIDELIAMKVTQRQDLDRDVPCLWSICGSNEPDAEDWTTVAVLHTPYTVQGETVVSECFDTQGFKHLRIYVDETTGSAGNRGWWGIAELQFYPGETIDPETSQYHMMGAVGTEMNDIYEALKGIDPNDITPAQYTAFKAAYEPFVEMFVDPTPLRTAIAIVQDADEMVVIGTDPGFWKDRTACDNLDQAIAEAKAYDAAGVYTEEASLAQIENIQSALVAIPDYAIPVQEGKWYRIRFGTEEEYADYGWNTSGNEAQYRTVDGEVTAVLNEANFGKYITVAKSELVQDEDDNGEFSYYTVRPLTKEEVAFDDQLYADDLKDLKDPDMALFRFIALGDSAYIIQNKATGLYLQKKPEDNNGIYLGVHPSFFSQEVQGYGVNALFIKTLNNEQQNPLHLARNKNVVITYPNYGDSDGRRGCFFIEEAGDVAPDYAVNTTSIRMMEGSMNARCYPATIQAVNDGQGAMWTVAKIERENDTAVKVTLGKISGNTAPAGVPFIYIVNGDYYEDEEPLDIAITFGSDFVAAPQNTGALKGVFTGTTVGQGILAIGATTIERTNYSITVNTDRAYIAEDEQFKRDTEVEIILDENYTGINTALQRVAKNGDIYTIDGTFVKHGNLNSLQGLKQGVYIINNVKVVVR